MTRFGKKKLSGVLEEDFQISFLRVRVMVFNTTFNKMSVKLWRSVLLVEETGEPGENHQPVVSH